MNNNISSFVTSEELLQIRENEIEQILKELKDTYSGLYRNITPLIVTNATEIDFSKIDSLAEELSIFASKKNKSLQPLYKSFCFVVICYLFCECNYEDRIWLSFFKIANTFGSNSDASLSNTTFGIMCSDAKDDNYPLNNLAYSFLLNALPEFENLYSTFYKEQNFSEDIKYAVEEYINTKRLNLLSTTESYNKLIRELNFAISRIQNI